MAVLPASNHEDSDFSPPGQRPPQNSRTEGPYSPPSVASRCRGAGPRHLRSRCWGMMAQVGKKGGDLRHWSAQETVLRRRSPTKNHTCAKSRAYLRQEWVPLVPRFVLHSSTHRSCPRRDGTCRRGGGSLPCGRPCPGPGRSSGRAGRWRCGKNGRCRGGGGLSFPAEDPGGRT